MKDIREKRLLTIQETARYIGVSPSTVRRWKNRGIFPPLYIGSRPYYTPEIVENFFKEQYKNRKG